jgi:hypothetical protein
MAVAAPASGVLVPLGPLERWMATVALWSLEDGGFIRIFIVGKEGDRPHRLRDPDRVDSVWLNLRSHTRSGVAPVRRTV